MKESYRDKLEIAKQKVTQVDKIVQEKVTRALEKERKEFIKIRDERDSLKARVEYLETTNKSYHEEKTQL